MPDQKDRLDELRQYSVPAVEYFWISGPEIAVHKGFLKYYTLTILIFGAILTLVTEHTNFWLILAVALWNLAFVKGWYITLPLLGVGAAFLYWRHGRSKKRKLEQRKTDDRRRKLDQILQ